MDKFAGFLGLGRTHHAHAAAQRHANAKLAVYGVARILFLPPHAGYLANLLTEYAPHAEAEAVG